MSPTASPPPEHVLVASTPDDLGLTRSTLLDKSAINLGLEYEPTSAELLAFRDEIESSKKADEDAMRKEEEAL